MKTARSAGSKNGLMPVNLTRKIKCEGLTYSCLQIFMICPMAANCAVVQCS